MKKPTKKTFYTITEAAKVLGISRPGVHDAIKKGRLKAKEGKIIRRVVTKAWKIDPKSLQSYEVALHKQAAGKKT